MMKTPLKILLPFVLFFMLLSCKKIDMNKMTSTEWSPSLAIPLINSTFDVYDIFDRTENKDIVVIDPSDGSITLVYKSDITSINGNQFIKISDFGITEGITSTDMSITGTPNFSGTVFYADSKEVDFNFDDGAQIDEFKFDGGILSLALNSSFQHPVKLKITIPSLKKNGSVFLKNITLTPAGGSSSTVIDEDLKGYIADLTLNNTTQNKLALEYEVEITGNGNPINATDEIEINCNFSNIRMDFAKGYFGTRDLAFPQDSIYLNVFGNSQQGHFELVDPKVYFYIQNSFGVPTNINLNSIKAENTNTGEIFNLLAYQQVHAINLPSTMGDSALTTLKFDKDNTANVKQLFSPTPKLFTFDAGMKINPLGDSGHKNFVSKKSKIKISGEVEFPLYGLAHSFNIRDTSDFSAPSEADLLESVLFRLISENGFPISMFASLNFLDENYATVFTISDSQNSLIQSAKTDAAGDVTANTKKTVDFKLTKEQIKLLDEVKYLEIFAAANTDDALNGKNVRIYDFYKLKLKVGVQFETKVKM